MADTKISGLTALTGANTASGDLLTIVDVSDTTMAATGTNKKITLTELQSAPVSAGTANGVLYLNGSKVATAGTALVFNGTQLGINISPTQAIDVSADAPAIAAFRSIGSSGNDKRLLITSGGDNIRLDSANQTGGAASMAFSVGSSEGMRLTSTGLGIGTSSPADKLQIGVNSSSPGFAAVRESIWENFIDTDYVSAYNNGGANNNGMAMLIGNAGRNGTAGTVRFALGLDAPNGAAMTAAIGTASNHPLSFGTNSIERMRLDSSGNLGLGVTPSAWGSGYTGLDIKYLGISNTGAGTVDCSFTQNGYYNGTNWIAKYTSPSKRYSISDSGHIWYNGASATAGTAITFTQAMTLDASGNLLVGATSTVGSAKFYVLGGVANFVSRMRNSDANPSGVEVSYTTATINSTGNDFLYCADATALRAEIRSNGGLANYSANNVNLSDRREKTNFAPAGSYLEKICAIPVQTFNYVDQNLEEDDGLTLGVVAQDVQAVAPELVTEGNWGTKDEPKMRLSIYQTDLQYALMKCIQEQQTLIQQLTDRVAQLESN